MDEVPKKVLIAEDEKDVAETLERGLRREGFEVVVALDGEEAKLKIDQESPDVILLDVIMPRLNGWEVLRWLRLEKHSSTPTIIVSAKAEMTDVKKGYALEADYYIIKPIKMQDVIKGINTLLAFHSQQDPPG